MLFKVCNLWQFAHSKRVFFNSSSMRNAEARFPTILDIPLSLVCLSMWSKSKIMQLFGSTTFGQKQQVPRATFKALSWTYSFLIAFPFWNVLNLWQQTHLRAHLAASSFIFFMLEQCVTCLIFCVGSMWSNSRTRQSDIPQSTQDLPSLNCFLWWRIAWCLLVFHSFFVSCDFNSRQYSQCLVSEPSCRLINCVNLYSLSHLGQCFFLVYKSSSARTFLNLALCSFRNLIGPYFF